MGKKLISVIVPCYCEEEAIPHYWEETAKVADSMTEVDFEFLFIDDGSKDHTVSILRRPFSVKKNDIKRQYDASDCDTHIRNVKIRKIISEKAKRQEICHVSQAEPFRQISARAAQYGGKTKHDRFIDCRSINQIKNQN